mmetsp:Transcript_12896/g.35628  ORF Transcript_12896/g.35628 Transcript_12896/m.35628 type:complete len:256 (+) Transcript_12896:810-1577(+)
MLCVVFIVKIELHGIPEHDAFRTIFMNPRHLRFVVPTLHFHVEGAIYLTAWKTVDTKDGELNNAKPVHREASEKVTDVTPYKRLFFPQKLHDVLAVQPHEQDDDHRQHLRQENLNAADNSCVHINETNEDHLQVDVRHCGHDQEYDDKVEEERNGEEKRHISADPLPAQPRHPPPPHTQHREHEDDEGNNKDSHHSNVLPSLRQIIMRLSYWEGHVDHGGLHVFADHWKLPASIAFEELFRVVRIGRTEYIPQRA